MEEEDGSFAPGSSRFATLFPGPSASGSVFEFSARVTMVVCALIASDHCPRGVSQPGDSIRVRGIDG